MLIIPAIDLKDNKCVRLTEGIDETSIVFNDDPKKQATFFQKNGCKKVHIVDLDAAFGRPEINVSSIKKIRKSLSIPIQLGGGIRTKSDAQKYFDLGIDNLIIGSMSVKKPEDVLYMSAKYKKRIYVSLDIKGSDIMINGWKEKSKLNLKDVFNIYGNTSIKGYVVTDIENDGMLRGLNTDFLENIINKIETDNISKSIILAGGLTNYDDLENLKKINFKNIEGVVAGKSFYVGNIDINKAQKILDTNG